MSVVEVKELTKVFKIPKKEPGLGGAAAFPRLSLLAVWIEVLFRDGNIRTASLILLI